MFNISNSFVQPCNWFDFRCGFLWPARLKWYSKRIFHFGRRRQFIGTFDASGRESDTTWCVRGELRRRRLSEGCILSVNDVFRKCWVICLLELNYWCFWLYFYFFHGARAQAWVFYVTVPHVSQCVTSGELDLKNLSICGSRVKRNLCVSIDRFYRFELWRRRLWNIPLGWVN